jgi:hypothetical protein
VAVREQSRARVVYRLPEPRRAAAGGGLGLRLLLVLLAFAAGLAVGRALFTARTAAPPATAASRPAATAPVAATAATAAPASGAATSEVGPRRVVDGVPVGYAHSQAGAVAAATNYATVLSSPLILDADRRHRAIQRLAAPRAAAGLQRAFDQTVPLIAKGLGARVGAGGEVVLRAIPVGWRLDRYDAAAAQVAIWATGVGGSLAGTPVQEGWGVTTVRLQWSGGDWKLVSTSTSDGPVPIADEQTPTAPAQLVPAAQAFKEYHYAPGP